MRWIAVLAGILALAAGRASADLPPQLLADAQENARMCREAGGSPRFQGGQVPGADETAEVYQPYATEVELNADGQPDFIVDLAGLECENAWTLFCGSAGCPVQVWLSGPNGPEVAWGSHAQAWRRDGQAVIVSLHGAMCSPPRSGHDSCEQELRFDEGEPAMGAAASSPRPRARPVGEAEATKVEPVAAPDAPSLPAAPDLQVAGWEYGGPTADGGGHFGVVRDAASGTRLDWLCGKGRASVLAISPYEGDGAVVVTVVGRREAVAMTVEGSRAYVPISLSAPLFLHIASGQEMEFSRPSGEVLGRFSMQGAPLAIGRAEGHCR